VVAITEGRDLAYGLRTLERLRERAVESHLVVRHAVRRRILEDGMQRWDDVRGSADHCYHDGNLAARIASGSFVTNGMVVAPCGPAALAAIATGFAGGLVERAADVTLKEGRPLVLLLASPPGSALETEHVRRLREAGAIVLWVTAGGPESTVNQVVDRVLAALPLPSEIAFSS
jgi:4-hydroxy-3-polyprenylbenzoate decarboxylase